jgi:serine/threonine protein kinase
MSTATMTTLVRAPNSVMLTVSSRDDVQEDVRVAPRPLPPVREVPDITVLPEVTQMAAAMMERLRDLEEQKELLLQQLVPEISEGRFVTPNLIENFTIVGSLGTGSFGRVYRAQNGETKKDVALKVTPTLEKFDVSREVAALRLIGSHKYIATLYSVFPASDTHAALELQLVVGTDLFEFLGNCAQTRVLSEELARTIFIGIAKGLSHCHSRGVVHRE